MFINNESKYPNVKVRAQNTHPSKDSVKTVGSKYFCCSKIYSFYSKIFSFLK